MNSKSDHVSLFGKKSVDCKAGEWTVLAETMASGMPRTYQFELQGEIIEGQFRVSRSFFPFGLGLTQVDGGDLKPGLRFDQGWFDVSYRIEVNPKADVTARAR